VAGTIFGDVAMSLSVAGAAFGDVAVPLFVAGTIFGDVGVSLFVAALFMAGARARNVVILNIKCVAEGRKVSSTNGRVQFCNFMLGHARIMLGSWSAAYCK